MGFSRELLFCLGRYTSSWTIYWEDCMFQTQKQISLLAIINNFFWSFCRYCTDKYMLFTNKTVRRIMFPRQKYENFGSLRSRAMIYVFFASFWFSSLYKSSWTRHITNVTNKRTCTDKLCDSPTKYWEECKNTQNSARSQSSIAFSRVSGFLVGMKNNYVFDTKVQQFRLARSVRSQWLVGISRVSGFLVGITEQDHITSVTNTIKDIIVPTNNDISTKY